MIKIDAIVNEDKMEDIKDALQKLKVNGMTISQVMGCGTQMGYREKIRGYDVDINVLPKVRSWYRAKNGQTEPSTPSANVHTPANTATEKFSSTNWRM